MKPIFALCTLFAVVAVSQAKPAIHTRPEIDPCALSLLARVAAKYEKAVWYRDESEISFGRKGFAGTEKMHDTLYVSNTGDLDLTRRAPDKTWHGVSDGNTLLSTRSDRPKVYRLEQLATPRFKREAILLRVDCEGLVIDALSRRMGNMLLNPGLRAVAMGKPVNIEGAFLRTVVISELYGAANRQKNGRLPSASLRTTPSDLWRAEPLMQKA